MHGRSHSNILLITGLQTLKVHMPKALCDSDSVAEIREALHSNRIPIAPLNVCRQAQKNDLAQSHPDPLNRQEMRVCIPCGYKREVKLLTPFYHLEWHINNEGWLIICSAEKIVSLPASHPGGKWCLKGYLNITRSDQQSQKDSLLIRTAKIFALSMTAKINNVPLATL